jgi:hypothetical protein
MTGSPLQSNMRKVGWLPQGGQGSGAYGGSGSAYGSWPESGYGYGTDNGPVLAANDTQATITGLPDFPARQDNPKQPLSLWLGGAVDFGQQYVNGHQAGFRFTTNGVSIGGDYRINDYATFGIGGGFSRDSSDVGDNGTKSTEESVVSAMYGSLRPAKDVFIDGVLGYGTLNFNSNCYITDGGGFATGHAPWRPAVRRHRQRCRVPPGQLDVVAIRPPGADVSHSRSIQRDGERPECADLLQADRAYHQGHAWGAGGRQVPDQHRYLGATGAA